MNKPKINISKICEYCNKQYFKNSQESYKQWQSRRFCNRSCANKALKQWKNLQIPRSIKYRRRISKALKGKKSHFWKGGITPLIKQIRRCFKSRQWRSDIFTRDDFTCQKCGQRGGWIEADHYPKSFSDIFHQNKIKTFEEAMYCEEFWNINNGRTLCKKCHDKTKGRKPNGNYF